MPTGLHLWSRTAASNATADSSINWAEGQSPSSVNDSARAMMARIAEWRDDLGGLTTSGSATAYSVSTNRGFASAAAMDKAIVTIIPHVTSGAAPTLAIDGLTARQLRTATGVNVPGGTLIAGTPYVLIYLNATTEFILLGAVATLGSLDVTGATALTTPDPADEVPLYDASVAANRKITLGNLFKVIDTFAAKTSPAATDELSVYDVAGTAAKKLLLSDVFKVIDALTAKTSPVAGDEVVIYDAAGAAPKKCTLAQARAALPAVTYSYLLSGSGSTYTTPANCRMIRVHIKGGGGSGARTQGGTVNGNSGSASSFNGVNANGGQGGLGNNGGAGGSGGSGAATIRWTGCDGNQGGNNGGGFDFGAAGGAGILGNGAGRGGDNSSGNASRPGGTNTGAGGGGDDGGGGGGAGEHAILEIQNPAASYTYTIGAGGTQNGAGTSAGGSGIIIVEEYY